MLPRLHGLLCALTLSVGLAAHAQAVEFQSIVFVSDTIGVTTNRLCVGAPMGAKASDIGCPADAPLLSAGGISASGIISASFFEGDGSRLTGVSGVSSLVSLTDVDAAGAANNSLLRFNSSSGNWEDAPLQDALGTTTTLSGWPDIIQCRSTDHHIMLWRQYSYDPGSPTNRTRYSYNGATTYLDFNTSTKAYMSHVGLGGYDCVAGSKSIATLYAEGKAFNVLGNNGTQISLTEIRDVSATAPTNGQALVWNDAQNRWIPGTVATSGGAGDRISTTNIASGAGLGMVVANYGTVSFTTGGVEGTSYLNTAGRWIGPGISLTTAHGISSTNGYFGTLLAGQVSATTISGTLIQVGGGNGAACSASTRGALRYSTTSSTVEYCNSSAWVSMGPSDTTVVSFHAVSSGNTAIGTSAVKINYTSELFDTVNGFELSTDTYTVVVPGKYLLITENYCRSSGGMTYCVAEMFKNGSLIAQSFGNNSSEQIIPAITIVDAEIGDSFEVRARGNGSSPYINLGARFSGALLSPQGSASGGGGASVAGADTQVQFNDGGSALGGDSGLTFNKTTDVLTGVTISATSAMNTRYVSTTKVFLANSSVDTCSDGSPVGTFRINPVDGHPEVCRPN